MFRRRAPGDEPEPRGKPDRSWPTRIAWGVLIGGFALVVTRASVATVVRIHGDGMAPTILDGDGVVLLRGAMSIERGDIVVYDPTPPPPPPEPAEPDELPGEEGEGAPQGRKAPTGAELRNTAVVDVEAVERRWDRMASTDAPSGPPESYRLGRVLAVPGDAVTFFVPDAPLGLAINGAPLVHEPAEPRRILVDGEAQMRATAFELAGEDEASGGYKVLVATDVPAWEALELPRDQGPIELRAEGYLIVADNRDESRCCDSRALGWISPDRLRGEIAVRIAASPPTTADGPDARRVQWLP